MSAKIKPATDFQLLNVQRAIKYLREAREALKFADCPKAVRRVRLAIASAGGAERHAAHRMRRSEKVKA